MNTKLETVDIDPREAPEWMDSPKAVLARDGVSRAGFLLSELLDQAYREGVRIPSSLNTPYINTISPSRHGRISITSSSSSTVTYNDWMARYAATARSFKNWKAHSEARAGTSSRWYGAGIGLRTCRNHSGRVAPILRSEQVPCSTGSAQSPARRWQDRNHPGDGSYFQVSHRTGGTESCRKLARLWWIRPGGLPTETIMIVFAIPGAMMNQRSEAVPR